jgi:NAD(P)-dependent dehydrogenase (short-subunit alcohol dehydrogenase family)
MSERVAIVAGAGGELGRATAEKLAAAGFTVAGVDRSEEGLKELPDGIRREAADPTDPAAARSVIDRIAAGIATYAVSKAALVHLTRVLDLELRPLGIRVNAVAPQLLDTAKNRPYLTPDLLAHAVAPEAVTDIIVYLVSDAAAPVSGAVVPTYGA